VECAAHHAGTGKIFACQARLPDGLERRAKHNSLTHAMPGTAHGSSGRVVLGPG
jgi:hypothetical protein